MGRLRKIWQDQRGYTLVELIVSSMIFILISIVAVGVFVSVSQTSSKTAAQRKVQQDVRVNIEEVARTIRSSKVDYAFYRESSSDPRCRLPTDGTGSRAVSLIQTQAGPSNTPVDTRIIFFYDPGSTPAQGTGALYRYETSADAPTPACGDLFAADNGKVRLTADNVAVTGTRFFVSPVVDPAGPACANPANQACQLPKNTHPRVTVSVTVRTIGVFATNVNEQSQFSETTLQTTVGSRAYPISGLVGQPEGGTPTTPTPTPEPAPEIIVRDGNDFFLCQVTGRSDYCQDDPGHLTAVYALSGGTGGNPPFRVAYTFAVPSAGTYDLKLSYYNFPLGNLNPPSGYGYRLTARALSPNGTVQDTVNVPIENASSAANPRVGLLLSDLNLPVGTVTVVIDWTNDSYSPGVFDANLGIVNVFLEG